MQRGEPPMKVEAIRQSDGFLISMNETFKGITKDRILLEVEILEPELSSEYQALDQLIGLCETGKTDASLQHDRILYTRREPE